MYINNQGTGPFQRCYTIRSENKSRDRTTPEVRRCPHPGQMYINNQGTGPFRRCLRSQAARTKTEVWTRHLFEVQRCFHPSRCTTKLGKSIEFQESNHKIDENSQQSTGVSLNLQSTKIDRSVSYKPPRHRKHLSLFQSISKQNKKKSNPMSNQNIESNSI